MNSHCEINLIQTRTKVGSVGTIYPTLTLGWIRYYLYLGIDSQNNTILTFEMKQNVLNWSITYITFSVCNIERYVAKESSLRNEFTSNEENKILQYCYTRPNNGNILVNC